MKISVIIPLYNAEETIKETIQSVIYQSIPDSLEILVINDGSTDSSEKIVQSIIQNNSTNRIIKLINKKNGGVSSARNRGILESNGDWVAFLDSDDIWFENKLQKQIDEVKKNNKIYFIGTNRNNEHYFFRRKSTFPIFTLNAKNIILKWYPHPSTTFVKKELLLRAGLFDEDRTHAEDGDLWLRLAQHCDIYILNENLVYTGGGKRSFGDSGLSANLEKMYQGEIIALKGAKQREQINILEYTGFYTWLTIKYIRRKIIVKYSK